MPTVRPIVALRGVTSVLIGLATLSAAGAWADPDDDPEALAAGVVVRLTAEAAPGVVASRTAPDLAWDWGVGAPDARLPADEFRLDASGTLLVQAPGAYRFFVRG